MPPMRGLGSGRKATDVKGTLKRLLSYIFGYKKRFILAMVLILVTTLASTSVSLLLGRLIDDYIKPLLLESDPSFDGLLGMLGIMACIFLCGIVSTYIYNRIMVSISQGVLKTVRKQMFDKMQTFPIKYFDTHKFGDIMSHYTNDTDTLRQMLSQTIPQTFSASITIIVVFVLMLSISVWLTLVVLCFVAIMLFCAGKVGGNSAKYYVARQQSLGRVNAHVEEFINGQKVVKVFNHEEKVKEQFDEKNEELRKNAGAAFIFSNILMPIMANIGNIQYVVLAVVGGALALKGVGGLTLGAIVTFLQLSRSFTMPLGNLSQQLGSFAMALAGSERIFRLIDEPSEEDEGYVRLVNAREENGEIVEADERTGMWAWKHPHHDGTVTYTKLAGDVRFEDVDFAYEEGKPVLHDINLYAEPGQKVAFVGATGAGKTTITNLINRFYDIQDGKIRYDGINIQKINKSDLRRSLGIVLQDVNLFTGTVMENIRYGRLDATDEEVIAAAKLANAHGFISMLPDGYDTVLTENGAGLSQGQRQLIAIARCAVADPPVMILDEATSSIDTRTEAIVSRGMDQLMHGRTVFVIAHRLSTVRNADVIMVLEMGRIIERGNHERLVSEKGKYYQLYTGAFELE